MALLGITQAYHIAVVSAVAPFEYVYILWASLIGYLMFADVPGPRTMIGGAVIVVSGCYIGLRTEGLLLPPSPLKRCASGNCVGELRRG